MPEALSSISGWFSAHHLFTLIRLALLIFVGLPLSVYCGKWVNRFIGKRFSAQQGMIAGKIVQYALLAIVIITVFNQMGFSLTPLLGAAGIVGIAVGFASQTSVSNVEEIGAGGLSGQPVFNKSNDVLKYIRKQNSTVPIIAVGGILSASDAKAKIEAGANLVQIYTGLVYKGPSLIKEINKALTN